MKQKKLLIILGTILILTILWVIFSIHHNRITTTIKDPLSFQILPIEGTFDQSAITKIKARQKINPLFESQTSPTPTPTEEVSPTPEEEVAIIEEEPTPTIEEFAENDPTVEDLTVTTDPNEVFQNE